MNDDNKLNELKVTALLEEYRHIRQETRQWEVLQVICMFLAEFVFVIMFTAGILSGEFVLFFVSPAISIFFIIVGMAMVSASTHLGIRSSQVAAQLKKILGDTTIDWENTVGIFGSISETIFTKKIAKYWWRAALVAIIIGVAPTAFAMWYGAEYYIEKINLLYAWLTAAGYVITIAIVITIFYKLMTWQKIKIKEVIADSETT